MNKQLIELITDTVSKRNEVHTETIYNACEAAGYVRGTYTSYLSLMKKAGYLRRVKPQVYAIGRPASTQTIALNLQRLALHKKQLKPIQDKLSIKVIPPQPETSDPKSTRILDAVDLLKSYGIKVTLEF